MNIKHLPQKPGVYLMRDSAANILYIGKAKNLCKRVARYFRKDAVHHAGRAAGHKSNVVYGAGAVSPKIPNLVALIRSIDYIASAGEREALLIERELIRQYQPFFNVLWKDAKSYPYIKLTAEDFPRVLFTRKKLRDGARYFGPYPKVEPLKKLLGYLRRIKFVNLRRCRWDLSLKDPLSPRKINSCLYYHTGQCPAPCAGRISAPAYARLAKRVEDFFNGEFKKLLKDFRGKMAAGSRRLDYETAATYRDFIGAIEHMAERVRVGEFKRDLVTRETLKTGSVTALMEALGLKKPPVHIEAFDTSSISGEYAVAASVCFVNGEKNTEHYRHYRIRFKNAPGGSNDTAMMNEAVKRRLAQLAAAGQELPDLILIDGGRGQLAAALAAMRELKLKIPVIALAKRLEEVYVPFRNRPLLLDRGHPALTLLQALRDEVHRFAVTYHRKLRNKGTLNCEK
ncbi:MAG: excinuclease ABC subunit UvrC [Elusimicrobia bacterium]|nr:excinuclease ABC subunit UvrC [Elusimicrobiota bacterium]